MIKRRAGGFTLVELMVVIVIVVVLAALIFSLTRNAMARSRLAASTSSVRNLGVMVMSYTQDNAGQLPVWRDGSDGHYWWGQLLKDPDNQVEREKFRSPGHKEFDPKGARPNLSYAWNADVVGRTSAFGDDGPKRLVGFREPARILVLTDGAAQNQEALLDARHLPDPERFDGKVAGLLLDGSARSLDINEFGPGSEWFKRESDR